MGEKPFKHRFYSGIISIAIELYAFAVMGCRKIARVLQIVLFRIGVPAPHHMTVRQWIHRYGCYQLEKSVEKFNSWVIIADAILDIGSMKCLAILGVKMEDFSNKKDVVLSHKDVTLLGLYPTEKLTGEYFETVLVETQEKVGTIEAVVIDEGTDVKKGARLYQEKHPEVKILHDIKHKMALVMKHHLEDDAVWGSYSEELAQTRRLVYQTELAALIPPSQRTKARYMDITDLIEWPARILEAKNEGRLDFIPKERYQQYFGWLEKYVESLETWSLMVAITSMICHEVRTHGLSEGLYEYLLTFFLEASLEKNIDPFIAECLEKVLEETDKLKNEETLICSTEVLESIFGKYKKINEGGQGITGNILGIGTFLKREYSDASIQETMTGCSVKAAKNWIKEKIGESTRSIRQKLLPRKGTKFDKNKKELLCS